MTIGRTLASRTILALRTAGSDFSDQPIDVPYADACAGGCTPGTRAEGVKTSGELSLRIPKPQHHLLQDLPVFNLLQTDSFRRHAGLRIGHASNCSATQNRL